MRDRASQGFGNEGEGLGWEGVRMGRRVEGRMVGRVGEGGDDVGMWNVRTMLGKDCSASSTRAARGAG